MDDSDAAWRALTHAEAAACAAPLSWQSEFVVELARCAGMQRQQGRGLGCVDRLDEVLERMDFEPFSDLWATAINAELAVARDSGDPLAFAVAAAEFAAHTCLVDAGRLRKREIETALASGDRAHAAERIDELGEWASSLGFMEVFDGVRRVAERAGLRQPWPAAPAHGLTHRERAVLEALADRLSNREIAARLYLGVRTVETYVSNLLAKLNAADRREAVAIAKESGLLR